MKPCIFIIDRRQPEKTRAFQSPSMASAFYAGRRTRDYICVVEKGPDSVVVDLSGEWISTEYIEKEMRKHL